MSGRDDYWHDNYLRAMRELKIYKEAIKDIKSYNPCYYEMDYDWDEEPIDNYQSLDVDYIVENIRKTMEIDEKENGKPSNILNFDSECYFTEEEQEAAQRVIKKMAIEPRDNFYDYYEEEEDKNE